MKTERERKKGNRARVLQRHRNKKETRERNLIWKVKKIKESES